MTENHHHEHAHSQPASENTATCPVMVGTPVDKEEAEQLGRVRQVNGKEYYLCCDTCVADFDANPEQYEK